MPRQAPPRGFPRAEFETRLSALQARMRLAEIDAVLLSTEPDVRYYTGFLTQFWQSPTRPWFLILPLDGAPTAVIPEIGASGMAGTWVEDIRTWPAPVPEDDGVTLLNDALSALPRRFGKLGLPMGHESHARVPLADLKRVLDGPHGLEPVDVAPILQDLRFVKSAAEIEKLRHICGIASDGFEHLPALLEAGETEVELCRRFKIDLMTRGADATPYMVAGSGPGGYDSIIMGPTDKIVETGDVLIIDTGSTFDGYFCDFDRNWSFGPAADDTRRAYETVWRATEAGFTAARPGATTSDVCNAMWSVLEAGGALGNTVGRLGHGLGIQLTEYPSNTPEDGTVLKPGAVLTLEPGMEFAPGRQMVHEENIVITEDGADWLTNRAAPELPVVG
jgi:Xaa-Pro dipeptidase